MNNKSTSSFKYLTSELVYPDPIKTDEGKDIRAFKELPSKIMKIVNEQTQTHQVIANFSESDGWKMTPHKPSMSQDPVSVPSDNLVGIPTFEGFEFIQDKDIIRCEGLQKCTCIIIKGKPNIVSSYNIGEFDKLLSKFNFFFCHKSHLVNLSCILRYSKDGRLVMCDESVVPVSRRRKKEFLDQFLHI